MEDGDHEDGIFCDVRSKLNSKPLTTCQSTFSTVCTNIQCCSSCLAYLATCFWGHTCSGMLNKRHDKNRGPYIEGESKLSTQWWYSCLAGDLHYFGLNASSMHVHPKYYGSNPCIVVNPLIIQKIGSANLPKLEVDSWFYHTIIHCASWILSHYSPTKSAYQSLLFGGLIHMFIELTGFPTLYSPIKHFEFPTLHPSKKTLDVFYLLFTKLVTVPHRIPWLSHV